MKLWQIYQNERETTEDFFNRSYWTNQNKVFIYTNSKQDKLETTWTTDEAKAYLETLTNNTNNKTKAEAKIPLTDMAKAELIQITTENDTTWINSMTGDTIHYFEKTKKEKDKERQQGGI